MTNSPRRLSLLPSIRSRRALGAIAAPVAVLLLLVAAPAALANKVQAPITRDGVVVGSADAYVGAANGIAVLDPRIVGFTPPVSGVAYSAFVQIRSGCNGTPYVRNSTVRTAVFNGSTTFRVNGLLRECPSASSSSLEVWLFVKRTSTGAIVGRARLVSAG